MSLRIIGSWLRSSVYVALTVWCTAGCVHQNDFFESYSLKKGADVPQVEAYFAKRAGEAPLAVQRAHEGMLQVGMPFDLSAAICGERLARVGGSTWTVRDEFPSFTGYDARRLYLYFDSRRQLAAIVVYGWRQGDPL